METETEMDVRASGAHRNVEQCVRSRIDGFHHATVPCKGYNLDANKNLISTDCL